MDLEREVSKIVGEFFDETERKTEELIMTTAEEACNDIKAYANSHGWKEYANGWTVKKKYGGKSVEATICNPKHYRLIHLLERGHIVVDRNKKTHGVTTAYPHIEPAEKKAVQKIHRGIRKAIKK